MRCCFWHGHWRPAFLSERSSSVACGGRLSGAFLHSGRRFGFFGSILLRMSITLVGFYFVGHENWKRWLLCLLGFVLARLVVQRLTRSPLEPRNAQAPETPCAP